VTVTLSSALVCRQRTAVPGAGGSTQGDAPSHAVNWSAPAMTTNPAGRNRNGACQWRLLHLTATSAIHRNVAIRYGPDRRVILPAEQSAGQVRFACPSRTDAP